MCSRIRPQAVTTIGSDLANITVQYLAEKLGLPGNSRECIENSTNKFQMRSAFLKAGIWTPFFGVVGENDVIQDSGLSGHCETYRPFRKPWDYQGRM